MMLNRGRFVLRNLAEIRRNVHALFQSHPKLANSCTGFLTFAAGDILSQLNLTSSNSGIVYIILDGSDLDAEIKFFVLVKECASESLDISRSLTIGLLGIFMNGICLHYWYRILDRFIGSSMKSKIGVFMKVNILEHMILNFMD